MNQPEVDILLYMTRGITQQITSSDFFPSSRHVIYNLIMILSQIN
jgi:hypothetical protein